MRAMYTPAPGRTEHLVVPAAAISASQPDDAAMLFDPRGRQDLTGTRRSTRCLKGRSTSERYDQQEALFTYCLRRGDDNLILSHRLANGADMVRSWRRTSHWRTARSITSDKLATTWQYAGHC